MIAAIFADVTWLGVVLGMVALRDLAEPEGKKRMPSENGNFSNTWVCFVSASFNEKTKRNTRQTIKKVLRYFPTLNVINRIEFKEVCR